MLKVDIHKSLPGITVEVNFSVTEGILVVFRSFRRREKHNPELYFRPAVTGQGEHFVEWEIFYSSTEKIAIPARNRHIGYVFQDYALFPHMTVKDNVMYGIPSRCKTGGGFRMTVLDVLEMLKITRCRIAIPVSCPAARNNG